MEFSLKGTISYQLPSSLYITNTGVELIKLNIETYLDFLELDKPKSLEKSNGISVNRISIFF